MKKCLTSSFIFLTIGVCLFAQQPSLDYNGPPDNFYWTGTSNYFGFMFRSTLGCLARNSDIIGVGVVSDLQKEGPYITSRHFCTVTVDHALAGCTNGQSIVIYDTPDMEWAGGGGSGMKIDYMPTNHSRIVFAVFTNDYVGSFRMYWNSPKIPCPPDEIQTQYELLYLNRSWWYPDRDDGVLFTQFTNVIQAVRFDRNWTNFFHLCRDGANSTSNRVREDSYWDMRHLAMFSTSERMQIILDDPLVDESHKFLLLKEGWKTKIPDP